ncbi:MAG: GNAT family N-acetyltransferase [Saprospiraceae bacterium]|nr:GNAT family N-acetyltransferase [Saprospiraceae bacterium]
MSATIRLYRPEDRAKCQRIFLGNCPHYFDPAEQVLFETCLDCLDRGQIIHKNAADSQFYVLEKDEQILACGGFYLTREESAAVMAWGMVDHKFHKAGLGSMLLQYRIDHLRKHYPEHQIRLDTSQHTYPFFERFGFTVIKMTPDGYGPGLDRYDMVIDRANAETDD